MTRNPTSMIHDWVRSGRVSPADGAKLLELRRLILWRRKPWWERAAIIAWRVIEAW